METRTAYILTDPSKILFLHNSLFATFDRALAEEMVMEFAYDWIYTKWYYAVHGEDGLTCGFMSSIYEYDLGYAPIEIKELTMHGYGLANL